MTDRDEILNRAIRRLNARAWGISMGMLLGGGLFVATNVLVLKGGPNVGQHLGLLSVYLPFRTRTFVATKRPPPCPFTSCTT